MINHSQFLDDAWRWLPTFRTVAEVEHLPTAARQLHVSASALSRTIGLVENSIGFPLFVRRSRRLVLNARGRQLLEAVRGSMGVMRSGLARLEGDPSGDFRISSLGPITNDYLVPSLLELAGEFPDITPVLSSAQPRAANGMLLSGRLNLALYYHAATEPGVSHVRLGTITSSIYCGKSHPLWKLKKVRMRDLGSHAFSVPQIDDTGASLDEWPPEIPRQVGLRIMALSTQMQVVRSGRFLAVLPDAAAAPHLKERTLKRLLPAPNGKTQLYAAFATSQVGHPYLERLLERLQSCVLGT